MRKVFCTLRESTFENGVRVSTVASKVEAKHAPRQLDTSRQPNNQKESSAIAGKSVVHPPGVEPGPIAWKAIILLWRSQDNVFVLWD